MEIIRYVNQRDIDKLILMDIDIGRFISDSLAKEDRMHHGEDIELNQNIPIKIIIPDKEE